MTDRDVAPTRRDNGRRTAMAIVALAFIASATTAILAFTASHRAQKADAANLAADSTDLHSVIADWHLQRDGAVDKTALGTRLAALSAWKPRTPCGAQARNHLGEAMKQDMARFVNDTDHSSPVDLRAALEKSLQECEASRGRDVNI
ncbi:MAG: hypothetical protein GAK28_03513 [Luteibacter sp.]|uniref:hypothetical protein n=1 Tax=Luteibacter sp. TaxID=1886636 RepID=UPI0013853C57|nr:hypothetical protein [Luteibacter sp.]KAF1005070.1 MAG: hypothetical protein GAK28_03513 [Luteibacter sp.]